MKRACMVDDLHVLFGECSHLNIARLQWKTRATSRYFRLNNKKLAPEPEPISERIQQQSNVAWTSNSRRIYLQFQDMTTTIFWPDDVPIDSEEVILGWKLSDEWYVVADVAPSTVSISGIRPICHHPEDIAAVPLGACSRFSGRLGKAYRSPKQHEYPKPISVYHLQMSQRRPATVLRSATSAFTSRRFSRQSFFAIFGLASTRGTVRSLPCDP
jgi:hypothetical protein